MSSSSTFAPAYPNGDNHSTEEATTATTAENAAENGYDDEEKHYEHYVREELIYKMENHPTTFTIDDSSSLSFSDLVHIILERCDLLMEYLTQSGRRIRSL